jgi:sugar O-acyltransferase (sialic acid O-acetyltransferase NeuD family)
MYKRLALYGAGGHASEVIAQLKSMNYSIARIFVDDQYVTEAFLPISHFNPEEYLMMIPVSNSQARQKMVKKLPKQTEFFSFIHPTALIMDKNTIKLGAGIFIGAYSILTTDIVVGDHAILNRGVHLGHGCRIGDYFSAMPSSVVSGDVKMGNNVYLGTNASVKEKITICDDVTIGMNSPVHHDILQSGIYVGDNLRKI